MCIIDDYQNLDSEDDGEFYSNDPFPVPIRPKLVFKSCHFVPTTVSCFRFLFWIFLASMIIMMIASLALVLLMIFFRADEENEFPLLQS